MEPELDSTEHRAEVHHLQRPPKRSERSATPCLDVILFQVWVIWVFPKIVVPPNHPILIGFSIINHPFWGTPIFGNTHMFLGFISANHRKHVPEESNQQPRSSISQRKISVQHPLVSNQFWVKSQASKRHEINLQGGTPHSTLAIFGDNAPPLRRHAENKGLHRHSNFFQ